MNDNTEALPPLPPAAYGNDCTTEEEAYTADQMRDYARAALAQRQQVPDARLEAAFREGYFSRETYNDKDVTDVDEQWEKARAALTAAPSAQAEPPEDIQQAMAPSRFSLYARDQQAAQAEPQEPLDIAAIRAACRAEALEEAAQEFDRRDKGVGGFYDPHEPAEIIRGLIHNAQPSGR